MAKTNVPDEIRVAAAGMLSPYGVNLTALLEKDVGGASAQACRYLSIAEVEERYSIRRWSLHRLIRAGKIIAAKTSAAKCGKVLVDVTSIERYLNSIKIRRTANE